MATIKQTQLLLAFLDQIFEQILALPAELRNYIYDYAWQNTTLRHSDLEYDVVAKYHNSEEHLNGFEVCPAWAFYHPQIRQEALVVFHRKAEFSVTEPASLAFPMPGLDLEKIPKFLDITKARHIAIGGVIQTGRFEPLSSTKVQGSQSNPYDEHALNIDYDQMKLIHNLLKNNMLRSLKINVHCEDISSSLAENSNISIAFSGLKSLCKIAPNIFLHCKVYQHYVWMHGNLFTSREVGQEFKKNTREEFKRFAGWIVQTLRYH